MALKMHLTESQSGGTEIILIGEEEKNMSSGLEKQIQTCPITPSHCDPIREIMSSTLRIVLFSVQTCIHILMMMSFFQQLAQL
jgi:hypothetical protein